MNLVNLRFRRLEGVEARPVSSEDVSLADVATGKFIVIHFYR